MGFGVEAAVGVTGGVAPSEPPENYGSVNAEGGIGPFSAEAELVHMAHGRATTPFSRGNVEREVKGGETKAPAPKPKLKSKAGAKPRMGLGGHVDLQMNFEGDSPLLTRLLHLIIGPPPKQENQPRVPIKCLGGPTPAISGPCP